MIHDFEEYEAGAVIRTDLCIIGSGAAGISLASEFLDTPWKVTILEGGGSRPEARSQDLYQAEIARLPHAGVHEGRFRTFGGSTTAWGGQLLPLCPADFQPRAWVPESGWPIDFGDLEPFYRRARG